MKFYSSAQSAMEYLMTYGWAILIILIVLGVLYLLQVFSPNSILGNQCNVQFKYSCTGFALATNGTASFLLGQNTGRDEFNIAVACTAGINSTGGPYASASPWIYLNASGAQKTSYSPSSAFRLNSGSSVQINTTPCYSTNGTAFGAHPIGTAFDGYLWMEYTTAPGPEGGANGWVIQRVATVYVAVGRTGGVGTTSASTTVLGSSTSSTSSSTTSSTSTTPATGTYATAGAITDTNTSLSAPKLTNAYSQYICAGGDGGLSTISVNWTSDVEDSSSYTSVGRSAKSCAILSGSSAPLSVSEVALNGAPAPSSVVFNSNPGEPVSISVAFNVTSNSSVVILAACSAGQNELCSGFSLPSGCIELQNNVGNGGVFSGAAVCSLQPGNYNASVVYPGVIRACARSRFPMPPCTATASIAAYVFPDYHPTLSS